MNHKMMAALGVVALLALVSGFIVLDDSSESDADDVNFTFVVGETYNEQMGMVSDPLGYKRTQSTVPPGMVVQGKGLTGGTGAPIYISGTPTTEGSYQIVFTTNIGRTVHNAYIEVVGSLQVTYNAGIGLVNGSSTWTEEIREGSYASLPNATYSSGAWKFAGWATTSGSSTVISSLKVTQDTTLYAVWEQQSTTISAYSATVTQGQSFSNTFTVTPADATIKVMTGAGVSNINVSGKTLSGTANMDPGTYSMIIQCSASGYKNTTIVVKITVPIVIHQPIEYTMTLGQTFTYQPETDPSNASITITGVKKDGSTLSSHGFTVNNRTITSTPTSTGTYAVTFKAEASGYVSVSKTVLIYVYDAPVEHKPVSIDSVDMTWRADKTRIVDLIAIGVANAVNVQWYIDDVLFASSSNTAVFEVPTAGVFTAVCKVTGSGGDTATASVKIVATEVYHKDMAWVGVPYGYVEVISGSDPTVSVSGPFSYEFETVGGIKYLIISGTPTSADLGNEYRITVGAESFDIKVYAKESSEPIATFAVTVNEMTISVVFLGSNASKVLYDYGNGEWTESTSATVTEAGYYTVRCKAINNVGERISSMLAEVGIVDVVTIDVNDLTDMTVDIGETLVLDVEMVEDEILSITGSASDHLTAEGNRIHGSFEEAGVYDLTVKVTHADNTTTVKTIKITVREQDDDDGAGMDKTIILGIVVLIIFIVGMIMILSSSGNKKTGGKKNSNLKKNSQKNRYKGWK